MGYRSSRWVGGGCLSYGTVNADVYTDNIPGGQIRDRISPVKEKTELLAWRNIDKPGCRAKEKESKMRRLFDVFVVDPEEDTIIWSNGDVPIIATNKENASLKAVAKANLQKDIDDYDIVVVCLGGNIRAKKTVQEVKVIK